MEIPCYECLCIPICRNKFMTDMIRECLLIHDFLFTFDDFNIRRRRKSDFIKNLNEIQKIMTPLKWEIEGTTIRRQVHVRKKLAAISSVNLESINEDSL